MLSTEVLAKDLVVTKVLDGDSFIVKEGNKTYQVRILGIDAPEYKQPYDDESRDYLKKLILGKSIKLKTNQKKFDRYNRKLAHVYVDKKDIGLDMITQGFAFYYRPYCRDYPLDKEKYNFDPTPYIKAENTAKKLKLNIWSLNNFEKPCDFRRKK